MLKKFLKLFKHNEEQVNPDLEGSYLDYVLSYVEQGVEQELQICNDHDPLLLVITNTLRVAMPGAWSEVITRPLVDPLKAPARKMPPPPPTGPVTPPPAVEQETLTETNEFDTMEFDVDDVEFLNAEAAKASGEELSKVEDVEHVESSHESGEEEAATVEVERTPTGEGEDTDESEEPAEELDEDSELIEEVTSTSPGYEATGEFSPLRSDDDKAIVDTLPRLDHREVLQAGRVFLGMLIENDRLPVELQLGLEELMLSRDLLLGQHLGADDLEQKAQQLLRIVERKFSEGQFSQARILLQLFQTDRPTRVRNDRNIFYEDMIQRLGIRRRHPVAKDLLDEYAALTLGDEPMRELSTWLDHKIFIKFHLFCRRADEVTRWTELAGKFSAPGSMDVLLRYLPPKRWRPFFPQLQEDAEPSTSSSLIHHVDDVRKLVRQHIHADTLSNYIISHVRTCYFVLRAVGDTGLEKYLDTFFGWTEKAFGFNATVFLPELYRRSMGDSDMMRAVFLDLYARYLREHAETWLATIDVDTIDAAAERVTQTLKSCNLNDVPPGNYDLGGFIYDALFEVEYPTTEFAFKVHRLT